MMSEEQEPRRSPSNAARERVTDGSDGVSKPECDAFELATAAIVRANPFDPKLYELSELELLEAVTALTREP